MRYELSSRLLACLPLLLLGGGCAENARDARARSSASTDVPLIFPHPAGWAEPERHGEAALSADRKLQAGRCSGCHAIEGSGGQIPGCLSCHPNFPHPEGWAAGPLHVDSLEATAADFRGKLTAACATSCHGADLAGGLSRIACADCHGTYPHVPGWTAAASHGAPVLASFADGTSECGTCHGPSLSGGRYAASCRACHALPDSSNPVQHPPAASGQCLSCHVEAEALAGGPHLLADSLPGLCRPCHGGQTSPKVYEHSPVATGRACASCHVPHDGLLPKLLTRAQPDLCLDCHNRTLTSARYGRTRNIEAEYLLSSNLHPPFADGDCGGCHAAHGSQYNHLQRADDPMFALEASTVLEQLSCFRCHDFAAYVTRTAFSRPNPVVRPSPGLPTQFVKVASSNAVNLHSLHVREGYGCLACHTPHGNDDSHLLRDWFARADVPSTRFWQKADCTESCHQRITPAGELW